jgi:GTPase SAR1 family protein
MNQQFLIENIDDFLNLFEKDEKFYANEIQNFKKIKDDLSAAKINVGVVGITGSGKSTFINALLGEQLLPSRMRPSTGVQVLCEWGPRTKAIILFNGKNRERKKEKNSSILHQLEEFGDETNNPKNKKEVKEIHLFSSKFCLNRKIRIIDTPGLDAYGLDYHEKITLQLVIPTVQILVFLTTVKSSSDSKNLELIDQITSENKPLLVVQNMIDSIEPKITARGIEKSSVEIAHEHKQRLQKLLSKAKKDTVKKAPIVQISAINGLKDKVKSGLNQFNDVFEGLISASAPERVLLFGNQIEVVLQNISDNLNARKIGAQENHRFVEQTKKEIADKKQHILNINKDLNEKITKIDKMTDELIAQGKSVLEQIKQRYKNNMKPESFDTTLKQKIDKITGPGAIQINRYISEAIQSMNRQLSEACKKLNLREDEIIQRTNIRIEQNHKVEISQEQIIEWKTRRVRKSGFMNKIKRIIGLGGFENEDYRVETNIVDVEKIINKFTYQLAKIDQFISQNTDTFVKNSEIALGVMSKTINNLEKSINEKQDTIIDLDYLNSVLLRIDFFKHQFGEFVNNFTKQEFKEESIGQEKKNEKQKISKISFELYKTAQEASILPLVAYRNKLIEKSGETKNIIIWGWDAFHIKKFADYFFPELLTETFTDSTEIWQQKGVTLVNGQYKDALVNIRFTGDAVYFVLINTIQIGSAKNKYEESRLKTLDGKFVWVMDSLEEHKEANGNNLAEAYSEMCRFAKSKKQNTVSLMVSDRSLYYSTLLHELFFNANDWTSTDIQKFITKMKKAFPNVDSNTTANYIDLFKINKGGTND